jgi:hypothetical protein
MAANKIEVILIQRLGRTLMDTCPQSSIHACGLCTPFNMVRILTVRILTVRILTVRILTVRILTVVCSSRGRMRATA